jgi:ubiquinone/menaquinone biosynthesis C-methylase UbiE
MRSPLNTFNRIAGFYDLMVKIVFGASMRKAQIHFLNKIPPDGNVLILGGGTGWIVGEILRTNPDVTIDYVEASDRMLMIAKRKLTQSFGKVRFIHGTERSIPPENEYDVVITNFYLDLFTDESLSRVIATVERNIKNRALWIATDFLATNFWHRCMLWIMYRFFVITCRIEASRLPHWQTILHKMGLREVGNRKFYGGFICSILYER